MIYNEDDLRRVVRDVLLTVSDALYRTCNWMCDEGEDRAIAGAIGGAAQFLVTLSAKPEEVLERARAYAMAENATGPEAVTPEPVRERNENEMTNGERRCKKPE